MAPKKPKNTGNRDKKPGNVADQSGFDAKSGNVYNLPLRTLDGEQMQTNHFRLGCEIKVGGDYKHWYQYALSGVQLKSGGVGTTNGSSTSTIGLFIPTELIQADISVDSTPTGQASSVSGDPTNSTEQDAAIAANATGDETSTTADGTAVNVALGTTPATTQRNPSARIIRRVKRLFCSVNLKNEKYKDIPMVTNLKDKLITASPLPAELIGQDHEVKFTDENEASSRDPPVIYTITLGEQKIIRIGEALEYLRTKDVTHISGENPENIVKDVLAAINVIFSQYANAISIRTTKNEPRFTAKGETIYVVPEKLEFGDDGHQTDVIENDGYAWNLKGGLIALAGYIRSTRAVHNAQDPFLLRINTKTSPFYYGATKDQGTVQDLIDNYRTSSKFSRTWREVEEFVTGLRVRTDYMRSSPTFKASNERSYTIGGLPYTSEESPDYWDEGNKTTPTVGNIKFTVRDKATSKERRWSVQDWFKDKHGVDLNSNANSTWVVRIGDHNFLPASRLHVLPGQPYKAALAQPISYGCRSPKDNLAMILKQGIGQVFCIKKGTIFDFGASFGLVIEETPMSIKYQLLTAPNLQYNSRTILGTPSWNLRSNKFKKSIDATSGAKWTYVHIHLASEAVDTAHVSKVQEGFEKALTKCGIEGLPYEDNEGKQHHSISVGSKNDVEYALQDWYGTWRSSIKESKLRVLLVMLGEENFYPAVKRWGDLSAGIATICIKRKGREYQTNDQYYGNVCMKFNQKSSPQTINHGLHNKSSILSRDTMLVGMDVVSQIQHRYMFVVLMYTRLILTDLHRKYLTRASKSLRLRSPVLRQWSQALTASSHSILPHLGTMILQALQISRKPQKKFSTLMACLTSASMHTKSITMIVYLNASFSSEMVFPKISFRPITRLRWHEFGNV